jgi:hypothetical protein
LTTCAEVRRLAAALLHQSILLAAAGGARGAPRGVRGFAAVMDVDGVGHESSFG